MTPAQNPTTADDQDCERDAATAKSSLTLWKGFWLSVVMIFFGLPLIDLYANFWLKPLVFFLFRFWDKYGW